MNLRFTCFCCGLNVLDSYFNCNHMTYKRFACECDNKSCENCDNSYYGVIAMYNTTCNYCDYYDDF